MLFSCPQCFCGSAEDDYEKYGSLRSRDCMMPCTAFPAELCGGDMAMEVRYKIRHSSQDVSSAQSTDSYFMFPFECQASYKYETLVNDLVSVDNVNL